MTVGKLLEILKSNMKVESSPCKRVTNADEAVTEVPLEVFQGSLPELLVINESEGRRRYSLFPVFNPSQSHVFQHLRVSQYGTFFAEEVIEKPIFKKSKNGQEESLQCVAATPVRRSKRLAKNPNKH
eukprot:TRINITY_DN6713_c0_g1_i3.p1 TRINITY_DN6713_c0_g1~~TRINITY_DN6713_c0_g1_i3.p1  ORF type:complete len:127 (-),score=31.80 TRINITY_DN6713_c0_g1_i3:40-420(-)